MFYERIDLNIENLSVEDMEISDMMLFEGITNFGEHDKDSDFYRAWLENVEIDLDFSNDMVYDVLNNAYRGDYDWEDL